jgi:hypothetical protein
VAAARLAALPAQQATHPPACIGLEFVWYAAQAAHLAAAQKQQQHQEATAHSAGGLHVVSRESALAQHQHSRGDLELLHQHSSSPAASEQLSASSASAAATTAPRHPPTSAPAAPATEGRPSVVQRLQDLHAEVSERLEGKVGVCLQRRGRSPRLRATRVDATPAWPRGACSAMPQAHLLATLS